MQGVVRMYDPLSGEGDRRHRHRPRRVVLAPTRSSGSLFRMLRQGQRVEFELDADGRATHVRTGSEPDMGLPNSAL